MVQLQKTIIGGSGREIKEFSSLEELVATCNMDQTNLVDITSKELERRLSEPSRGIEYEIREVE